MVKHDFKGKAPITITPIQGWWNLLAGHSPRNIAPKWSFPGRTGQHATDPINATLNYTYGILESECWRAIHIAGLDPYAGYLHQNKLGKPSFVYDLIEPFRYLADKVVLHLHDKSQLKKKDYTTTFRGHTRIKPPLTTLIVDKMNKALYKSTVYQGQAMMARTAIQRKTWLLREII